MLEICIDSVASARAAAEGGADRVELCAALPEGGTTPSAGMIEQVRKVFPGKVMVIIRPRGYDFLFDPDEHAVMRCDVRNARDAGADGIVIGCLHADGTVDQENCRALINEAPGLDVTFHRAFDMSRDLRESLQTIYDLGIRRILSSGGKVDVPSGAAILRELNGFLPPGMVIMPGGGISPENLADVLEETRAREVHLSSRRGVTSGMVFRNAGCHMGDFTRKDEYAWRVASAQSILRCREILDCHLAANP
ncbi:MAG: copper homeostasis protein CutC [Verrucomicrobiales bacterium]